MRLLNVSNRLPVHVKFQDGNLTISPSAGGLATGLSAFLESCPKELEFLWIGWPGKELNHEEFQILNNKLRKDYNSLPVSIPESLNEKFYYGFCNKTLWPLFHYFPGFTEYNPEHWEAYLEVNQIFCSFIDKFIQPGDILWIHDYHFLILPRLIRERHPDIEIGFFLHIPFPTYEIFRLLPKKWREELLLGMLGADLIGFHTHDYTQYFLRCILRILGIENNLGEVIMDTRLVKVDTFPMGIHFEKFFNLANQPKTQDLISKVKNNFPNQKLILSVDRLDYSKGVSARLEAFEKFLENYPEWKEKATLLMVVVPSRTEVDQYQEMKKAIDEIVGRINGRFSTMSWNPIHYLYRMLVIDELVPLYSASDAILVTPYRDGMNLVSKEYIACKPNQKGVLILSEMAGAARELGEAIIVNPNNIDEMAEAIRDALEMPEEDQIRCMSAMQERIKRYNVIRWADDFIGKLKQRSQFKNKLKSRILNEDLKKKIYNKFKESSKRLIFLDYDGTLVPFQNKPQLAIPSLELKDLLNDLTKLKNTEIVIISGRDKETLTKWMEGLEISIVAEHGAWILEKNKNWRIFKQAPTDWKPKIRPLLEQISDRLPGSFVEEKNFSLVWHYRSADPELAEIRVKELMDDLFYYTANLDVTIMQGNKVIEVKNTGISKGYSGLDLIGIYKPDFIISIGDDWTDEDLFRALPETAITIKVGISPSIAKYNLKDYIEVRNFLRGLVHEA